MLEVLVHASPSDLASHLLLTDACLELGPSCQDEAVSVARRAYDASVKGATDEQAGCAVGVAVALGSAARDARLPEAAKQAQRLEAVGLLQTVADAATAGSAFALVHYNLGVLLAEAGKLDKAMAHARMALEAVSGAQPVVVSVLASDDQGAAAKQTQLVTLCLVLCALLMTTRQQHSAALRLLAACPAPEHQSADASGVEPLHMCEVLLARTRARLCASHLGDAAAAMALLARLKRRCVSAVAGGERAHTQAEMRATIWQDLALLCASAGDTAHAHVCVAQALKLCPWQARSHCVLGEVHEASGGAAEAMEAYNTALALEPTCAAALLKLGTMYLRRGTPPDVAVAHELLSDCLRYDASSAASWFQLGLAARALGHSVESEATLATAVKLARSQPALPFSDCPLLLRV